MMVTAPEPTLAELRAQEGSRTYTTEEVLAYCRAKAEQARLNGPAPGAAD